MLQLVICAKICRCDAAFTIYWLPTVVDDDLDPLITCCPGCDTRFRVTQAQLQVASGRVRCGACLNVFDGTDHLMMDEKNFVAAENDDVDPVPEDVEFEVGDEANDRSETGTDESGPEPQKTGRTAGSADLEEQRTRQEPKPIETGEDGGTQSVPSVMATSDDERLTEVESSENTRLSAAMPRILSPRAGQSGETVAQVEESSEGAEIVGDTSGSAATNTPSTNIENIDLTGTALPPVDTGEAIEDLGRGTDTDDAVMIVDERSGRGLGTWIVVVVALIALPAQVLWFQYAEWVKDDTYRPIYSYMCRVAGCELPPLRNVGLIVATNSVLRDHPDRKGAVVYDALLVNRAQYEQPFPYLELTLTTMGGQLVAGRRFHPNEYLNGEALSAKIMQSHTPVHISLEMKDPGQAPLNFQIRFVATDQVE